MNRSRRFWICAAAAVLPSVPASAADVAGWSLDLTGRVQLAATTGKADLTGFSDRFSDVEVRRARVGVDGERGRLSFRAEIATGDDPLFDELFFEDVWVEYDAGPLAIGVGQWKPPVTLEHQTSSRHIVPFERASIVEAFGLARRLGVQAARRGARYSFEAGVFAGNAANDEDAAAEGTAVAARAHYNPILSDDLIVHLGGSVQRREAEDGQLFRYRARPRIHLSDRFVDTGAFADTDVYVGAEAGAIVGRLHLIVEHGALAAEGPGADANLNGGYLEGGFFLTPGDRLGYDGGLIDRTPPARPVGEGGIGAWMLRGRIDRIDLADGPIAGGAQTAYSVGLNWFATGHVRVVSELTQVEIDDGPDGSGNVGSASVRFAVDW